MKKLYISLSKYIQVKTSKKKEYLLLLLSYIQLPFPAANKAQGCIALGHGLRKLLVETT